MLYRATCDWLEQPKSLFLLVCMRLYLDRRVLGLKVEGLRMFSTVGGAGFVFANVMLGKCRFCVRC